MGHNDAPPASLIWNMTRKCNFRCHYCYFPHDNSPEQDPIPAQKIADFLDSTGHEWLVGMTGGEPFIYPGFVDICKTLTKNHRIAVDTNLSLSRQVRRFAQELDPARVEELYVALHIEERERIGGVQSFIENVRLLQQKGFHVRVNSVVHPTLVERFIADRERFAAHGITIVPRPFKGKFEGRPYPESYGPEVREIFAAEPEAGKKVAFDFHGVDCDAGMRLLRMEPDGTVLRCPGDKTVLGNVLTGVTLYDGPTPCTKHRCPCRGVEYVHLTETEHDFVQGVQYANVGDAEKSRAAYERVVRQTPDFGPALNNLGVVHWREGNTDEARNAFRRGCDCGDLAACRNTEASREDGDDFVPQVSLRVR